MAARHVLEMVHEQYIDDTAARRPDDRNRFRRRLLRNDHTEARGNDCDQPDNRRSAFLQNATLRQISGSFGDRFAHRRADNPIGALR